MSACVVKVVYMQLYYIHTRDKSEFSQVWWVEGYFYMQHLPFQR